MKPSILTISSLVYVVGFVFLMSSNPKLFESKDINRDKCFMMFFIAGISAAIIYHIILTIHN